MTLKSTLIKTTTKIQLVNVVLATKMASRVSYTGATYGAVTSQTQHAQRKGIV